MQDEIAELIQTVAAQNKIVLNRDDPLLLLATIHNELIKKHRIEQQALLEDFQRKLAITQAELTEQTEARSQMMVQTVISKTLGGAQDILRDKAVTCADNIQNAFDEKLLQPMTRRLQYYAYLTLISACCSLGSAMAALALFWLH